MEHFYCQGRLNAPVRKFQKIGFLLGVSLYAIAAAVLTARRTGAHYRDGSSDYEVLRAVEVQYRWAYSGNRPGTGQRTGVDDGVDESRLAGEDRCHRQNPFLEPLAAEVLDEGRNQRPCA